MTNIPQSQITSSEMLLTIKHAFKITKNNFKAIFIISLLLSTALFVSTLTLPKILSNILDFLGIIIVFCGAAFFSLQTPTTLSNDLDNFVLFTKKNFVKLIIPTLVAYLLIIAGLVLFIIPGILLYTALLFNQYCVIFEKIGTQKSIERSFELVKGRFWQIQWYLFCLMGIMAIILLIAIYPMIFIAFDYISNIPNTVNLDNPLDLSLLRSKSLSLFWSFIFRIIEHITRFTLQISICLVYFKLSRELSSSSIQL